VLTLDRDLAKAILYQGNISLGVFEENMHLKRTVAQLAGEAGLGGYVPPKRHRMSKELLDFHYNKLQPVVDKVLLSASSSECVLFKTCTLDGWDNAARTHLLGVMAVSRRGGIHVETVDTTGVDLLGKDWTIAQMERITEAQGGDSKVAAWVLDSPSVNRGALAAFELKHPAVPGLYCVCHCISLFLKDVFDKLDFFKTSWQRVHDVCKKFRSVKWLREKLQSK